MKTSASTLSIMLVVFLTAFQAKAAENYTLTFDSLPSSQGWTYVGDQLTENAAFAVNGSMLTQTTTSAGDAATATYRINDIVDTVRPMRLFITARVLQYERLPGSSSHLAFNLRISDRGDSHQLQLSDRGVLINGQFLGLDTTEFHDYELLMYPDGEFELIVDDKLITTGMGMGRTFTNEIFFGDSAGSENADMEITALSFSVGTLQPRISEELHSYFLEAEGFDIDPEGVQWPRRYYITVYPALGEGEASFEVWVTDDQGNEFNATRLKYPVFIEVEGKVIRATDTDPRRRFFIECVPLGWNVTRSDGTERMHTDEDGWVYRWRFSRIERRIQCDVEGSHGNFPAEGTRVEEHRWPF